MKLSSKWLAFIHEVAIAEEEVDQLLPGSSFSVVDRFLDMNETDMINYIGNLVVSTQEKKEIFLRKLKEISRLDLSIEAVILKKFRNYFDNSIIEQCKSKLSSLGYVV